MLGCCTISPNLPEILPCNYTLEPDVHYIKCKDDYSDLIDKIEICKENPQFCKDIAQNAKKIGNFCTAESLMKWIRMRI
jgi:hypothetical protein